MDERRFQELMKKRDTEGLTQDEANELGRMMAEREGRAYGSASGQDHPEGEPDDEQPYSEAEKKELEQHPDVRQTSEESQKAS